MALSTKKKNIIMAQWKAGKFKNPTAAAKHHKIDRKTAAKILKNIPQSNAQLSELAGEVERQKKSLKNPVEIAAVEERGKELSIADQIEEEVLGGTLDNVRGIRKSIQAGTKETKVNMGDGMQRIEPIALDPSDHKNAQDALDKALITAGKAARHAPKGDVNVNNTENNIKAHIEYIVEMPVEDNLDEVEVIEVDPIEVDE